MRHSTRNIPSASRGGRTRLSLSGPSCVRPLLRRPCLQQRHAAEPAHLLYGFHHPLLMIPTSLKRPRNVDTPRAAAILYGDWGTSKAYVIGLAFAVGGYASFWLIALMCVLTALVGINYMIICRLYPDGGGVYASVRHVQGSHLDRRSVSPRCRLPRHRRNQRAFGLPISRRSASGKVRRRRYPHHRFTKSARAETHRRSRLSISVPTAIVVVLLGLLSLPHLGTAVANLQPLHGGFWHSWGGFVGIVLALSGVEAIANTTGVMKLDPGSTDSNPSVTGLPRPRSCGS